MSTLCLNLFKVLCRPQVSSLLMIFQLGSAALILGLSGLYNGLVTQSQMVETRTYHPLTLFLALDLFIGPISISLLTGIPAIVAFHRYFQL